MLNSETSPNKSSNCVEVSEPTYVAYSGSRRIASGKPAEVARKTKKLLDQNESASILIFDAITSRPVEIDWRGTAQDVVDRLSQSMPVETPEVSDKRGPGRPRLGVIPREVTLLPRHWDWLNEQPGGASVALRKLVEEARRSNQGKDRARHSQESVHRFMYAMAGNLPDFEEASRAFYARNSKRFAELIRLWPKDIRDHLKKLVEIADTDAAALAVS
jgi:hypothetical protein